MASAVKRSTLAGTWYPADPRELRELVEQLLGDDRVGDASARAFIVPHAGYRYSGSTAAAAYSLIPPRRWRRAVVIAPSHYAAFSGAAVFPGDAFETPLGTVAIDPEGAEQLVDMPLFDAASEPYEREHSLEIQIPFLQVVDPALSILPVLVGTAEDGAVLERLADGLRAVLDDQTLVIVSSDFTHYGAHFDYMPFVPDGPVEAAGELRRLDLGAIDPICRGDVEGFARYLRATGITICGRGPISTFLRLERGMLSGELTRYATSLDVTGDYEHSVSYAAITFRGEAEAA